MADIQKTTKTLNLTMGFADGDDRILAIDNPKNGISADDVKGFETVAKSGQVLVGDKTGAAFVKFTDAVIVEKTVTDFDFSN